MRRQAFPPHIKVAGPTSAPPQRFGLTDNGNTVVVNHYSNADKLIPAIPGFKTSAAFLTSLSANLRIDPDLPSPLGTPNTFRTTSHSYLPPPSPLHFSTISSAYNPYPSPAETEIMSTSSTVQSAPQNPTDGIPTLTYLAAETEDDRVDALKLVADSVAQQRQVSSKMLIFHPFHFAVFVAALALLVQWTGFKTTDQMLLFGTTAGGMLMIYLVAVRMATSGYLALAENINWDWLGDDKLLIVKWGEDVIGALVLGWADEAQKKKNARRRRGKAVVRAWTVKLKYRGKGVGEGLLEEAIKIAGERGADGIVFDDAHANSDRILPRFYNSFLNKRDERAAKALEKVADEKGNFRQRRSSPTWGSR